jgi:hypothetical protein
MTLEQLERRLDLMEATIDNMDLGAAAQYQWDKYYFASLNQFKEEQNNETD